MDVWDNLGQYKKFGTFAGPYPESIRRFFAPDDDVHGALMAVLGSTSLSLAGSMYGYDDDSVNQFILGLASNPKIPVQLALDKSQSGGVHEKALIEQWPQSLAGADLAIGQSRDHAINHLKLFVIDGLYTIGGSTNWSASGEQKQNNELIVVRDATYAAETRAKVDLCFSEMRQQAA